MLTNTAYKRLSLGSFWARETKASFGGWFDRKGKGGHFLFVWNVTEARWEMAPVVPSGAGSEHVAGVHTNDSQQERRRFVELLGDKNAAMPLRLALSRRRKPKFAGWGAKVMGSNL